MVVVDYGHDYALADVTCLFLGCRDFQVLPSGVGVEGVFRE